MTTTAPTSRRAAAAGRQDNDARLTFLRAVHAEWIKLTSLRSSYVILTITLLGMVGVCMLKAFSVADMASGFACCLRRSRRAAKDRTGIVEEFGIMARGRSPPRESSSPSS